jgi:hypothetical protein
MLSQRGNIHIGNNAKFTNFLIILKLGLFVCMLLYYLKALYRVFVNNKV